MDRLGSVRTAIKGSLCCLLIACVLYSGLAFGAASKGRPETIDGQALLSLIAKSKGKVVLINFWATWCSSCRREIRDLLALRRDFSKEDLLIAGIAMDDRRAVKSYLDSHPLNYKAYLAESDIQYLFGVSGVPKTLIYDRRGQLALKEFGYIPGRRLRDLISSLLEVE